MKINQLFVYCGFAMTCLAFVPGRSDAAVVLDQIGDVNAGDFVFQTVFTPSQHFPDFPAFDCAVLDDFTVTSSELQLTRVSALFRAQAGFVSFQDVQSYYINVFSDVNLAAAGLTGDVASLNVIAGSGASVSQVIDSSGDNEYGLVILDIDLRLLAAGSYWIGVSPVASGSTTGQFFLQAGSPAGPMLPGNLNARLANPALGFGAGALLALGSDYAYSITVVPEPSSTALWLIGGGGLLWRRQRKRPTASDH